MSLVLMIYQKPTCSTCRKVMKLIKEQGLSMEVVNYYTEPLTPQHLTLLIKKMGIKPEGLLRKKEHLYKELEIASKNYAHDELIALMIQYPDLMQRPIVERGSRAVLARPIERVKELFNK